MRSRGRGSDRRPARGRRRRAEAGRARKEHYRERLRGTFNSFPVAGNGRVYVSNNDGVTFVVKAGTEFEVAGTNLLGERITASPAITGDAMIYRTDSHLYCFGALPKR